MIKYPPKLALATTPTPLQYLSRLSAYIGGPKIWIKRDDLTGCSATGNKVRKLEFILSKIIADGGDTLITAGGTQSNHCRAVAVLGAHLGLKVHLLLREDGIVRPVGNLFLDHITGAEIDHYSPLEFKQLDALFDTWSKYYIEQGRKPHVIPIGGSNSCGVWGYISAVSELIIDFNNAGIIPSTIVHATGSGGTQAGLIAGKHLYQLDCAIHSYAVCDSASYFESKVLSDLNNWKKDFQISIDLNQLIISTNDNYIGAGYGKACKEIYDTIKLVASLEGVVLDPVYSGKAFYGMLEEIKAGRYDNHSDIVFIHTGGIFGLLAEHDQIIF